MIADSATGSGFTGAIGYTTSKAEGEERGWRGWASDQLGISDPLDAVQTRNILLDEDPEMAAEEMRVTANQNERVQNERYSVSLSYHPDDEPSDQEMIRDMDDFLERRGLGEHQAVLAVHRDEEHAHIHATINRVHPGSGDLWRDSYDYFENMTVCREIERERGWTRPKRDDSRGRIPDWKLRKAERTDQLPFSKVVEAAAGDIFEDAETWDELQKRLAQKGLQVQRKGSGGIVTDGKETAPLSEVARKWSFNRLNERFPDQFQTYGRTERADRPGDRAEEAADRGFGGDQARDRDTGTAGHPDQGRPREGQKQNGGDGGAHHGDRDDERRDHRPEEDRTTGSEDLRREGGGTDADSDDREKSGGDRGRDRKPANQDGQEHGGSDDDRRGGRGGDDDVDPLDYRNAEPLGMDQGGTQAPESQGHITHAERLSQRGRRVSDLLLDEKYEQAARTWDRMDPDQAREDWEHFGREDRRKLREAVDALKASVDDQSSNQSKSQERDKDQGKGQSKGGSRWQGGGRSR